MLSTLNVLLALALGRSASAQELLPIPSIAVSCPATPIGHRYCGLQIGKQFSDRFEKALSTNSSWALYETVTAGKGHAQRVFDAMKATAQRVYPDYMQELQGMADGSKLPLDLLLASNWAQEIRMALAGSEDGASSSAPVVDRCSDVLMDSAFAHNEDGGIGDFDTIFLVRMRTYAADGTAVDDFTSITYPGRLPGWGPGWNSRGFAWTSNVLYAKPQKPLQDGVGVTFVSRDAARATSIDDYIKRVSPAGLMAGQNQNVGSFAERRVVTIETAPGGGWNKLEVRGAASPTFHANEYLRMKDVPQDEANLHLTSARHRHATFLRSPPIKDASGLLALLGDTSDEDFPVFRRNDKTKEFTLFTVCFDLAQRSVQFFRANPRLGQRALLWHEWIAPENDRQAVTFV